MNPQRAWQLAHDDANLPELVLEVLRDLAWTLALNPENHPDTSPTRPPFEGPP